MLGVIKSSMLPCYYSSCLMNINHPFQNTEALLKQKCKKQTILKEVGKYTATDLTHIFTQKNCIFIFHPWPLPSTLIMQILHDALCAVTSQTCTLLPWKQYCHLFWVFVCLPPPEEKYTALLKMFIY